MLFSAIFLSLLFLNIRIDWILFKTYDQQFTLTTKKSLHIIFKAMTSTSGLAVSLHQPYDFCWKGTLLPSYKLYPWSWKFLSKEEKWQKFSWHTCKISFENHFWKRLSKENFLVCHYLKEWNYGTFAAYVLCVQHDGRDAACHVAPSAGRADTWLTIQAGRRRTFRCLHRSSFSCITTVLPLHLWVSSLAEHRSRRQLWSN